MARLMGMQPPLPQAARAINNAHGATGAQVAPGLVPLPPAGSPPRLTAVLIGRLAVCDAFGRQVAPHIGHPLGDMLAAMAGLAPLEIEPGRILAGAVVGVRAVVDAGWLSIGIPLLDLLATGLHLRLVARAIRTHQVDQRAGTVARHQVAAVARVFI